MISGYHELNFALKTLVGVVQPQSISLSGLNKSQTQRFNIDAKLLTKWQKTFNTRAGVLPQHTYHWRTQVHFFLTMMLRIRFNYGNVLHLKNEIKFFCSDFSQFLAWTVEQSVRSVYRYSDTRIVLEFFSSVKDDHGNDVMQLTDYILIKNVNKQALESLLDDVSAAPNDLYEGRARSNSVSSAWVTPIRIKFSFPQIMAYRYGRISGDYNPTHTFPSAARLFGHPTAFSAGLCTTNYVIAKLAEQQRSLTSLSSIYKSPLFFGKEYCLVLGDEHFEIISDKEDLVCFGHFKTAS